MTLCQYVVSAVWKQAIRAFLNWQVKVCSMPSGSRVIW